MSASPSAPIGAFVIPVTPLQQNCTVVWCQATKACAVIDPGGEADLVLAEISRRGLTVEKIWITHGHLDHAGAAQAVKTATGVPIEGPHPDDLFWIEGIEAQGALYGMPEARSFTPDRWLDDQDEVTLGQTRWQVRHCPGHTPGHVVFFNAEARFAQVGDVLFKGSIGRTDFPRSDHQALLTSISSRLWPMGSDVTFVPGHGPASTFAEERRTNPFVADHILKA